MSTNSKFKKGDKVISIGICGLCSEVPIGTIGIVHSTYIIDIFVEFENVPHGSKYAGTFSDPKIEFYEEKVTNWQKEMKDGI